MTKFLFLFYFLSLSVLAVDYSAYELTELQLNLLERLEKKGYPEETLHRFAGVFHRSNTQPKHEEYIPPHTEQDLEDTQKWAAGSAFFNYQKQAGVSFNREQYVADCPNWALFGFLKATGNHYIDINILRDAINTQFSLDYLFRTSSNFRKDYLELAEEKGFFKYITP